MWRHIVLVLELLSVVVLKVYIADLLIQVTALILFVGVLVLKLAHVTSIVHLDAYCAAMHVLLLVLT